MQTITIRADFLRVARKFLAPATGFKSDNQKAQFVGSYILLTPHPNKGVHIVSTDGAAMCVQHDVEGHVDQPYVLSLKADISKHIDVEQDSINDLWFQDDGTDGWLVDPFNKVEVFRRKSCRVAANVVGPNGELIGSPDAVAYPNWAAVVPKDENLEPGFPKSLNCCYLSAIATMYSSDPGSRQVMLWFERTEYFSRMVARFPWRPSMMVICAGMKETAGLFPSPTGLLMGNLPSSLLEDDEDPAEGL